MNRWTTVVLAGALAFAACRRDEAAAPAHEDAHAEAEKSGEGAEGHAEDEVRIAPEMLRDLRVTTAPAEARPGGEGVTLLGELAPDQAAYAEVGSPVPGRVARVLVAASARVDKGAPLAEVQSAEVGRAKAAFLTARARAGTARAAAERKRGLAQERVVSEREAQEAEADAVATAADLKAARMGLLALGLSPDDVDGEGTGGLVLRSPVAGTVLERSVVLGQRVGPETTLFRVGNLSRLWLVVHAFERDALRIKPGAPARVSFPALPGQAFSARVTQVGQEVERASRTLPVRLELDNPEGRLRPGMSASAFLPLGETEERVTTVPAAALQRLAGGWYVFIPRAEGVFERREVGRGRTLGSEVEVLTGLKAGERVVVEGAFLLKAEAEKSEGGGEHHEH